MEFAIRHKLDGNDAETGSFEAEAEALAWWESWGKDHPGDRIRDWVLVERASGRVVASHGASGA